MQEEAGILEKQPTKMGSKETGRADELPETDIKHNIKVNVLLECIFILGSSDFITVLGALCAYLGASNKFIGTISSLAVLSILGTVISPYISNRFAYKKKYVFVSHLPYIGAFGLIAMGIFFSASFGWSNEQLLKFIFAMMVLNFLAAGFVTLPKQEFLAACIPMRYRGFYMGLSLGIGSIGGIASSVLQGFILLRFAKPMAFGWSFLLIWIFCQSGYLFALFARESRSPIERSPKPYSKEMFISFWKDKNYQKFLSIYFLFFTLINPAIMFVPIYGYKELDMIPATAAVIAIIQQAVRMLLSSHIGLYTDRLSPKKVLPVWFVIAALSFVPLLMIKNAYAVYISIAVSSLCLAGATISLNALMLGLPSPENRSGHFTIAIFLRNLSEFVGMLLMGFLCDAIGFSIVFVIWVPLSLTLFIMAWKLLKPLSSNSKDYA